jgi:subtilisin family serine protease
MVWKGKTQVTCLKEISDSTSESGKQWFTDLSSDTHRVIENRPITRRSKIAILDSGIDWSHPCFQEAIDERRVITKSFVEGLSGDMDSDGHGTHTAHLALKVAPNSKLFIARVYEHGNEEEFDANISAMVEVRTIRLKNESRLRRLTSPR